MINGLSFDVEDWFQVENLRNIFPSEKWDNYELRVEKNTDILLNLLAKHNTRATFFVLGWIAQRIPELVRRIASGGHEISSHGYNHDIIYNLLPKEFEEDLLKSKIILENLVNQPVIGYRAPNFSITKKSLWAIDILAKHGFKYDSSIFPTTFHNRYGFKESKTYTFSFNNGIKEFTLTTFRFGKINIPIAGGGYFRLIPYRIFRLFLNRINNKGQYFIFYLHPWEIDNGQPRVNIKRNYRFRHYVNLDKTYNKLDNLLREFKFDKLNSLL